MTELTKEEQNVVDALRLSAPAAEKLLTQIQRHIAASKAEMKRVGIPPAYIDAGGELIQNAITDYCLARLDNIENRKDYQDAFKYQIDCIRKSYKTILSQESKDEE